jgi:hypothetical protein
MPEADSAAVWIIAVTAAFCIGLSKTGFGGLGIVSILLFAEIFPAKQSTGVLLPLMIAADFLGVYFYRRHANWADLLKLLPATFAGVVCGWWLMPRVPQKLFEQITLKRKMGSWGNCNVLCVSRFHRSAMNWLGDSPLEDNSLHSRSLGRFGSFHFPF